MNGQLLDVAALRAEMNLDREEIDQRKARLGLDDADVALLKEMGELVDPHIGTIIDALADNLVDHDNGFRGDSEHGRRLLREYFGELTSAGDIDDAFVERRLALVDALRQHVSSEVSWYLAAYLFYLTEVAGRLRELSGDPEEMQSRQRTLAKVMFLDLSLAVDARAYDHDRTIRAREREIEELSTPVLQLREGLLILPIVGMLDSRRAQQLTEQLLHAIRTRRAKVVVLDVTGVAAVDSRVANHLIQTVDAARLMGATAIISGISVEVAQTLVGLGISLGTICTVAELQDGVDEADRVLGLRVVAVKDLQVAGDPA